MTGRRPSRGGSGDPWRGARPPRPDDAGRDVEVEELPGQVVARRGKARLSIPATLASAALVGLLAAGFGALGGRQVPSTGSSAKPGSSSGVAADSAAGPRTHTGPPPTPAVTPFRACGSLPEEPAGEDPPEPDPPEVYLIVDGRVTVATMQVGAPDPDGLPTPGGGEVEVPIDARTEVWMEGALCALAWEITFETGVGQVLTLEAQDNPDMNPAFASQNRFVVDIGRYAPGPGVLLLRAELLLEDWRLFATWPIRPITR